MATARKNPKRVAAGKKAARTRKRNRSTTTTTRRRRRTTTRSKGLLSELWNPAMAQGGFKATASGAAGAGLTVLIDKGTQSLQPGWRHAINFGGAFVMATLGKLPNTGAGMAGAALVLALQDAGMLSEGGYLEADYADPIESLPAVLNENGEPMDYLSEADEMYLNEQGVYSLGYYPAGFGG